MDHVPSCIVFWEGSSSLMEAREGSLESVSKTLSTRLHLFLECTVPFSVFAFRQAYFGIFHENYFMELLHTVILLSYPAVAHPLII